MSNTKGIQDAPHKEFINPSKPKENLKIQENFITKKIFQKKMLKSPKRDKKWNNQIKKGKKNSTRFHKQNTIIKGFIESNLINLFTKISFTEQHNLVRLSKRDFRNVLKYALGWISSNFVPYFFSQNPYIYPFFLLFWNVNYFSFCQVTF